MRRLAVAWLTLGMATMTTPDDAKVCVCCAVEEQDGAREADEVFRGIGECVYCHQQGCEYHAREYRIGFAHEACHEAPDMTRTDEGNY